MLFDSVSHKLEDPNHYLDQILGLSEYQQTQTFLSVRVHVDIKA